ncbi:hypothetical protein ACFRIB_45235 [Streptomyces mirabilis]|uniref:hypothetical protein n=1 Tax=Streptomyces mirabilis TaxID=68239 RepID=UPI0036AEC59F
MNRDFTGHARDQLWGAEGPVFLRLTVLGGGRLRVGVQDSGSRVPVPFCKPSATALWTSGAYGGGVPSAPPSCPALVQVMGASSERVSEVSYSLVQRNVLGVCPQK